MRRCHDPTSARISRPSMSTWPETRIEQAEQDVDERALPGARCADDADRFAATDRQAHVVERRATAIFVGVAHRLEIDPIGEQQRLRACRIPIPMRAAARARLKSLQSPSTCGRAPWNMAKLSISRFAEGTTRNPAYAYSAINPIRLPPLAPRDVTRITAIRMATTKVLSTNTRTAVDRAPLPLSD